jgi:two-component system sensor histidine kinase YesM
MKAKSMTLRTRFIIALAIYGVLASILWVGYYQISYNTISRIAKENTILVAENLIEQISLDFEQMNASAATIAGSGYVKDFLSERNKSVLYEKAVPVSEIISKTAFPITSSDSVITINADGDFYRFSGGLNNQSCQMLYEEFKDAGTVYTVAKLGETLYFCYNTPVYDLSGIKPDRIGSVVMLTGISKTRRALENLNGAPVIDTALILDSEIVLSNNPSLEQKPISELENQYAVVSTIGISGTPLSVAAAIPDSSLFPESNVFVITSFAFFGLLIITVAVLYNYLSGFFVRPMANIISNIREIGGGTKDRLPGTGRQNFDALVADINEMLDRTEQYNAELISERQKSFDAELIRQKMQMGLLASQMDAHFVFNTLTNIENLAEKGDYEKAAGMANGLAVLLRHQQKGDTLANVFDEFQVLEKYITVMNIRFDGKFAYEYDLDENLSDCLMPGFILQPIIENALTHGLQNRDQDARLSIRGTIQEHKIYFEISDNGVGIPPGKLKTIREDLLLDVIDDFPEPGLHGVALQNIQSRIHLKFGVEYGISIGSELDKGTTVTIILPYILEKRNDLTAL